MTNPNASEIIKNVGILINDYGDYLKSDWHLLILYWNKIDLIEMKDKKFSTIDMINKATNPKYILDAKMLIDEMIRESGMND